MLQIDLICLNIYKYVQNLMKYSKFLNKFKVITSQKIDIEKNIFNQKKKL